MNHAVLAVLIQLSMFGFGQSLWTGCAAAVLVFAMREVTQAEYRWIEAHGGLRAAMPWWKGMDVTLWTAHSITDVLVPAAVTAGLAYLWPLLRVWL